MYVRKNIYICTYILMYIITYMYIFINVYIYTHCVAPTSR